MSVREIVTVGDPVLRERAREVSAGELRSVEVAEERGVRIPMREQDG